mmetsp:Transcript_10487/g.17094  ORF Transcript_10487/g.17094 Transcript_10487/m.17094 type:complete len:201 (+) Transcript_10487:709-1311(+)
MGSVRFINSIIPHNFTVSMISSNDKCSFLLFYSFHKISQTFIHSFHSLNCSWKASSMANHIWVCKICNYHVEFRRVDSIDQLFTHFRRRHLWLQVICSDFGRRYQNSLLACKWLLTPTVEEERNVRVLFSFCNPKLCQTRISCNLSQWLLNVLDRENRIHVLFMLIRVLYHSSYICKLRSNRSIRTDTHFSGWVWISQSS